ncbi:MAG: hypothetical protein QXN71_03780 [Candidatus Aenigmatarchaeota archaeon]
MDIVRRIFDLKYTKVRKYLEDLGFGKEEDAVIALNGKRKAVIGNDKLILIKDKKAEEMSYESFIDLIEKYKKITSLVEKKGFVKSRSLFGVDVYRSKTYPLNRILVGRDFRVIFGNVMDKSTKATFDYDGALQFLEYY